MTETYDPAAADLQATALLARSTRMTAKGVAVALGGVIAASGLSYLAGILAAGVAGAAEFGRYTLALSTAALVATVALTAVDRGLLRYVAIYRRERDLERERTTVLAVLAWIIGTSGLAALLVYGFSTRVATLFGADPTLARLLRVLALAVPLVNILAVLNATTDARRDMRYRVFTSDLARTGSFLLLVAIGAQVTRLTADWLAWAYMGSYVTALSLAVFLLRADLGRPRHGLRATLSPVLAFSLPFLIAQALTQAGQYVGVFLLGMMGTAREVGIFGASAILAGGIGLVLDAISRIYSPTVADLLERGDVSHTEHLLRHVTRWALVWSAPIVAIALLYGRQLMTLVGREYATAELALAVLVVGQAVNAATGPIGVVLNMSGHAWLSVLNLVLGLGLRLGLGLWLIPGFGVLGAAAATAAAIIVLNLLRVAQVRALLKIWGYDSTSAGPVLAAVLAAATAWLAGRALGLHDGLRQLLVGCVIVLVVYGTGLLLFGLAPQDREILRSGFRKVRGWNGHVDGS